MDTSLTIRMFEHNRWANERLVEACAGLTDKQLDEAIGSGGWSLREVLRHTITSDRAYLSLLTLPLEARTKIDIAFEDLGAAAHASGSGLIDYVAEHGDGGADAIIETTDGYEVAPWVVLVQVINHGNHHRRQACGILRQLGIEPPDLDGWSYGEVTGDLRKVDPSA